MSTLALVRGLPASGKTTFAKNWVAADPTGRARVSRDDIRETMWPGYSTPDHEREKIVTHVETDWVLSLLKAGKHVVVDATHLRASYIRRWYDLWPDVVVWDFPIDVELAIFRDAQRQARGERCVGEAVIRDMAARFLKKGALPPAPERAAGSFNVFRPYVPDESLPKAILVDTDGTVARNVGRSPYDPTLYHTDEPIRNVIEVVQRLDASGLLIIGLSGRDETYRDATLSWWQDSGIPFHEFYMRPAGDTRNDSIIKDELFEEFVARRYNVIGAIDDRLRVARMWHAKGITLFRVGDPDADF